MQKLFLLLAALLALPIIGSAQLEGGLMLGFATHRGDLHETRDANIKFFDETHPAYGLLLRYKFTEQIAFRTQGAYFLLTGSDMNFSDEGRQNRAYSFRNSIFELTGLVEYDLHAYFRRSDKKIHTSLSPYVFAGAGIDFSSPMVDFNGAENGPMMAAVQTDQSASKTLLALPVGIGFRYNMTKIISIGAEGGFRLPVSDYYDGVSHAANKDRNDSYAICNVFFTMRISKIDTDGDGLADDKDACPEIAGKEKLQGCPDSDRDGVRDSDDLCPNQRGIKAFGGCPDSDKDGIQDSKDTCPELAGLAVYNGCPDTDGDGVSDDKDTCPKFAGLPALEGCPDHDGDGIRNKRDVCPSEYGPKSTKGCPDTDGDGIADVEDSCPDVAGILELAGCPIENTEKQDRINTATSSPKVAETLKNNEDLNTITSEGQQAKAIPKTMTFEPIYFGSNKSELNAKDKLNLDEIVGLMTTNTNYQLDLWGYTDNVGLAATNQQLSLRRAEICAAYLIEKGIATSRLLSKGLGEVNPIGDNATPEGRASNRRVELRLK